MADLSPLRRCRIKALTFRNMSPTTQRLYVNAVSKFNRYCGRSPGHLEIAFPMDLPASEIVNIRQDMRGHAAVGCNISPANPD
jgi:hypothetical protein